MERLITVQARDRIVQLQTALNQSQALAKANNDRCEALNSAYSTMVREELQGRALYQRDENGNEVGMSLRYNAVPNLTFQMRGADNPVIRLLNRHVCATIGYTIVVAVKDFKLNSECLLDFLLAITGFNGAITLKNDEIIKWFNSLCEQAQSLNWTKFTMSLHGMLKIRYGLKRQGEYSTQLSVGQIYDLVKRANMWLIDKEMPRSLWLIAQADIAYAIAHARGIHAPQPQQEQHQQGMLSPLQQDQGLLKNIEQLLHEYQLVHLNDIVLHPQQAQPDGGVETEPDEEEEDEEKEYNSVYDDYVPSQEWIHRSPVDIDDDERREAEFLHEFRSSVSEPKGPVHDVPD